MAYIMKLLPFPILIFPSVIFFLILWFIFVLIFYKLSNREVSIEFRAISYS